MALGKADPALGTSLAGAEGGGGCSSYWLSTGRRPSPLPLGAGSLPASREAAAFPASRLRFEFSKGSACAWVLEHGSAIQSVSSKLFSKGFGQSLQRRLGVREAEFSLIRCWHWSPEQRGSAHVTTTPISEPEEKVGSCSGW